MKKGVPVEVKTIHYDIMSPIKNLKLALEIVDMGMEVVEQVITMADGPEENTITNGIETIQTTSNTIMIEKHNYSKRRRVTRESHIGLHRKRTKYAT